MAKLDLAEGDAETLCGVLDIEIEAWEDELGRICEQEHFDSWEALLEATVFAEQIVATLTRLRNQLDV
jgi:hypothetical protein